MGKEEKRRERRRRRWKGKRNGKRLPGGARADRRWPVGEIGRINLAVVAGGDEHLNDGRTPLRGTMPRCGSAELHQKPNSITSSLGGASTTISSTSDE
uniref:Uncharacterized protein n=1 Tax=Oryza nivara TaxID=4536 RepID=A0A0E0HNB7_ORYNI